MNSYFLLRGPNTSVSDNAKALTQGDFARKACQTRCTIDSTDPFSPMVSTSCPFILWYYALEFSAILCSHTALDLHQLNGNVPETLMTGEISVISHNCEFSWLYLILRWGPLQ